MIIAGGNSRSQSGIGRVGGKGSGALFGRCGIDTQLG